MLYIVCPTCRELLGNKQLLYETHIEKINKLNISDEERSELQQQLVQELVELYCCRQRLMTYRNLVEIIM